MKLLTFPIRLLVRLLLLPVKLVLATAGLTFRAGFKAGTLPVKGSAVAVRKLGFKAVVLFVAGVALGVLIGRRLGAPGAELAEATFPDDFGSDDGPAEVTTMVEDTLEVVDTPDGPVVELVEDTIEVVETPDGEIVTETVTVNDVTDAVAEIEGEVELADEIEAEIDQALGVTGGELGVDVGDEES